MGDERASVGIIGGSGLYKMDGLQDVSEVEVATPFGKPSDAFILGTLEGRKVAFLARHARGHRLLPSELPFRANLWAMKSLGVERILSVSAVGSLKEKYEPLHMVIPDQFVDRTFARASTFFGQGHKMSGLGEDLGRLPHRLVGAAASVAPRCGGWC